MDMGYRAGLSASLALAVLLWAGFSGPALAEKRVALVIGNSAYANVGALPNPANDAAKIGAMLKASGFEVVDVRQNAGVADMRRAFSNFSESAHDADFAVVFYAGHGIEVDGTNYLIPVDARLLRDFDVEDEAISLDRVLKVIEPAKRLRLVMVDACRDNPFSKTMKRTVTSRSIGRGLARVDPTVSDTLIAFAAKAGSVADDGDGANSPFTTAVLKHLVSPGLDLRIAFGLVRDDVMQTTHNRQEPWVYGSLGGNVVALVPGANMPAAPSGQPVPGLPGDAARIDFDQAQRTNTPEAWQAFLRLYPSGALADRAKDKLALLTPPNSAAPKPAPPRPQAANKPAAGTALAPDQQAQLIYSPWTKFCLKGEEANAKPVCFTGKDARVESGAPVVAAVLIEPEGEPKKLLRVTLPLGMQITHGTRVIIDQDKPLTAPYVICPTNGCMADYEATPEMIDKLKKGQTITVQAINTQGTAVSLALPLADFAKAYDGPPTDAKVYEEQQRKVQEELQRRAAEAEKKPAR
jgi:invasion protein IalB